MYRARRWKLAALAAGLAVVPAIIAIVSRAGQAPPPVVYREPDDPAVAVLGRADRRIYSDDPKDYTAEASDRGLRELDEAIAKSRRTRGCTGIAI